MEFSRQEYWSGYLFPYLLDPGIKPGFPALQADSLLSEPPGKPWCLLLQIRSVQSLSRVQLFATPWTVDRQAPLSIRFPRQEYWGGLPFPSPGDLSNPGIKRMSLESPALAGRFLPTEPSGKPQSKTVRHSVVSDSLQLHGL